jgi:hypothetical protein
MTGHSVPVEDVRGFVRILVARYGSVRYAKLEAAVPTPVDA